MKHWLLTASNVKPQGYPLWKAIWTAWSSVCGGGSKANVMTRDEKLEQPLYLNRDICGSTGLPLGIKRKSKFRNWSVKGLYFVRDIWDVEHGRMLDAAALRRRTRSPNIANIISEVASAVSNWDLITPKHLEAGD